MNKLEAVKKLINTFDSYQVDDGEIIGRLSLSNLSPDNLVQLYKSGVIEGSITIDGSKRLDVENVSRKIEHIKSISEFIEIYISLPELRKHDVFIYPTIEDAVTSNPIAPEKFILLNLDTFEPVDITDSSNATGIVHHYFKVKALWLLLKKFEDDSSANSITYLYKQKLDISLEYEFSDLENELDGFSLTQDLLDNEKHSLEKAHILKNVLLSMLANIPARSRFSFLLKSFDNFSIQVNEGYRTFVVGFSFEKVRKEYEEKYREYVGKINAVLTESLTKSLAVPVSLLLSFSGQKAIKSGDITSILTNVGVVLVSLVIFVFMTYMVQGHKRMLRITKREYTGLVKRIDAELGGDSPSDVADLKREFDYHHKGVISTLNVLHMVALFNVSLSVCVFIVHYCSCNLFF